MQTLAGPGDSSGLSSQNRNGPFGQSVSWRELLLGWLVTSVVMLAVKSRMLDDPYFWDEMGCYFSQVYQMSTRLGPYLASRPAYVRSPLLTSLLALLHHFGGPSRVLQHGAMVIVCSLVPPATYALTYQLGASKKIALLAALLCVTTPAFFAQCGLVQMDLPATGFCALAFVCVLRGNLLGFAILGSAAVLIKESTYYVCLPAALTVYGRMILIEKRRPWALGTLLRLWPTAIPGLTLFGWLLVHRQITGSLISGDHTAVIGLHGIVPSLLHNFVEGRRLALTLCAAGCLWQLRSHGSLPQRITVATTAVLWIALPFCFPGHLVRYLFPSLPALCALAALGVSLLPIPQRAGLATLIVMILASGFRSDSIHDNSVIELEGNLSYRLFLQEQMMVVRRVAETGAKLVISDFPYNNLFPSPREFGYIDQPIATTVLFPMKKPEELCVGDVVIMSAVSEGMQPLLDQAVAQGVIKPWFTAAGDNFPVGKSFFVPQSARRDLRVQVYRVTCPSK